MISILEEMYYGNIRPDECIHPKGPEYQALNQKISNSMEDFKKQFSADDFKFLEELCDLLERVFKPNLAIIK